MLCELAFWLHAVVDKRKGQDNKSWRNDIQTTGRANMPLFGLIILIKIVNRVDILQSY